ncbi:MAG: hypothetical protein M3Y62_00245, partial [Candidatus Dormibacteraeota bacterium]|nr:hypothetical protein [Candidatus Dormibacteraeota bacterium]
PTLSLHLGLKGRADLAPVQSRGSSGGGSTPAGWLDEVSQPDSGLQAALWVGGTDSSAAQAAAAALYENGLTHRVELVAADRSIRAPTGAAQESVVSTPLELRIAELLPVLALAALLVFLGLEMTRLRRSFQ